MNYENLIFNYQNQVAFITLNRPQVYHALNSALIQEITHAVSAASADEAIRAIVLTASGDKAFCSGADLKSGLESSELGDTLRKNYNPMVLAMRNAPKPIICRLNGIAAGAGMSLALACDVIIANKEAYLSELFVGIGLMPDAGSMYFLPRIIGERRTFELCSTGRKVSMDEALQWGLINDAVPYDELDEAVEKVLGYYRSAATLSIGLMKKVLGKSLHSSLEEMLELEADNQTILGKTADFAEGVMAFIQKRPAQFKGK